MLNSYGMLNSELAVIEMAPVVPVQINVPIWRGRPGGVDTHDLLAQQADPRHQKLARAAVARALGSRREDVLRDIFQTQPSGLALSVKSSSTALRILRSGRILNGYERYILQNWEDEAYADLDVHGRLIALAAAYKSQLDDWGHGRFRVERALRFGPDCRYLATSWDTRGVNEFGPITFHFRVPSSTVTFFDGDSARIAKIGGRHLLEAALVHRGCTASALCDLLVHKLAASRLSLTSPLNRSHLDATLKSNPEIIEAHLHGALTVSHLSYITFASTYHVSMKELLISAVDRGITKLGPKTDERTAEELDELYYFLLLRREISRVKRKTG